MGKRILYITNGLSGSGGLERVVCIKASYLADIATHDVHIIVLNEADRKPFYDISGKVHIHNINTPSGIIGFYYRYIRETRRILREISPDVIFVADDGLKGLYAPLLFNTKAKFIYERHTTKAINGTGIKARIVNKLMDFGSRFYDNFVVLTERNSRDWPEASGLTVIPNPLPFSSRESVTPINQRRKLISVGSMSYFKGHDILLRAWAEIHDKFPDFTLHIYGAKKDNYPHLCNIIEESGLQNDTFLHSPVTDIRDRYAESAICILPSRVEGFGMVVIEAMECGTPCIATACEGPMDIIHDNCDGNIVPIDDAGKMADAISCLLSSPQKLQQYSAASRCTAKQYSIDRIMDNWVNLIM